MSVVARQFIGLLGLSVLFIAMIIRLSRRRQLSYRYAIGWLLFGITIGLSAFSLSVLGPVAEFIGIPRLNIGILALVVVVLSIAIELSLAISKLSDRQRTLGMLEAINNARHPEPLQDLPSQRDTSVLVVIPALNEVESVGSVVEGCLGAGFDCVVIDDGSTDGTGDIALKAGAHVLTAPFNLGIGVALRAGFIFAVQHGYRRVVQCDADGQHSPASIQKLLDVELKEGVELVVGSRFLESNEYPVGRIRWMMMRFLARRATATTGTLITDATSGFRCISGELLTECARQYPTDYMDSYEVLMAAGIAGYRVIEVYTPMNERQTGVASNNPISAAFHTLKVLTTGLIGTKLTLREPTR